MCHHPQTCFILFFSPDCKSLILLSKDREGREATVESNPFLENIPTPPSTSSTSSRLKHASAMSAINAGLLYEPTREVLWLGWSEEESGAVHSQLLQSHYFEAAACQKAD